MDDQERIELGIDRARATIDEAEEMHWENQDRDVLLATLVLQNKVYRD